MLSAETRDVAKLLEPAVTLYPNGMSWLHHRLRQVLDGDAYCIVAVHNDVICAASILTPKGSKIAKLSTIYVDSESRGLKVGSRLTDWTLSLSDRLGYQELYVTVAHHIAVPVVALLMRKGFSQTAFELDRYGLGRHELVLTRLAHD